LWVCSIYTAEKEESLLLACLLACLLSGDALWFPYLLINATEQLHRSWRSSIAELAILLGEMAGWTIDLASLPALYRIILRPHL
jgi:hypothetical protein